MHLHLFRHGETDWNAERRIQGQSESRLSELGIQQAQALGQRIAQLHFDQVYCSSSLRTRQTAEHAFAHRANDIKYLDTLREIDLGPWEGKLYAQIESEQPEAFRHFWQEPHLFNVSGAETFGQLQQRAIKAISGIKSAPQTGHVAIVSHGALIKSLLCHYQNKQLSELWAPPAMHNCAHSIIRLQDDGTARIVQYADQLMEGNQL